MLSQPFRGRGKEAAPDRRTFTESRMTDYHAAPGGHRTRHKADLTRWVGQMLGKQLSRGPSDLGFTTYRAETTFFIIW